MKKLTNDQIHDLVVWLDLAATDVYRAESSIQAAKMRVDAARKKMKELEDQE